MTQTSIVPEARVPWLIQGGMGIAISGWPLARAVASAGQLGVVSGTAIDNVFVRRLQEYGVDTELQGVLDQFPLQSVVDEVLGDFASRKRIASEPFRTLPMLTHRNTDRSIDIVVLSSFVEVALAKLGHDGDVGINLLTKVQIPTAATLFGAMLAGVDYVVMGAGVPTHIPGALQRLSLGEPVDLPLSVTGASSDNPATSLHFDPSRYLGSRALSRPRFLAIVSSHVLANALAKRSNGPVDGFVLERPVAGGHNAPPRGEFSIDVDGNPVYGPRDVVDFEVLRNLGVPFWIGGGVTSREDVEDAMALGASGVQVGTLFAYCDESGMDPDLRREVLDTLRVTSIDVRTSLRASSTGYPFKVAAVSGTISDPKVYDERTRKCDLGYLREPYLRLDGSVAYRCAAEPVSAYTRKGGSPAATVDVACLCNGLMATCGLGQVRSDGRAESAIVTSGDRLDDVRQLLQGRNSYSAGDVIAHLDGASVASC